MNLEKRVNCSIFSRTLRSSGQPIGTGEIFLGFVWHWRWFLHDAGTQSHRQRRSPTPARPPVSQQRSSRAGNRQLCRTAGAD